MGNYNLPTNSGQLIGLGNKMVEGMQALSSTLGLTLISTAQMQANLAAFVAQDSDFNAARSARKTASDAYQAALGDIYNWLLGVSNTLATKWGTRWSTQWAQAGFTNNSTAIPTRIEDRLGLTLAMVNFFTANPGYEMPALGQTAAHGTTLRAAALAAQSAATSATVALNSIGALWQSAYDTLVAGMRALLDNLRNKLAKDDPRWLSFGLQMPATVTTPGKPQNVSAHLDQTGAIIVQCDAVALATRYRFRMLLVDLEQNYQLAASSMEPLASISGVAPGQTAQIIVQAVNGSLQGVASDPIQFAVPLPVAKATPEKKALLVMEPEKGEHAHGSGHRSGNGNGNGNGAAPARMALG